MRSHLSPKRGSSVLILVLLLLTLSPVLAAAQMPVPGTLTPGTAVPGTPVPPIPNRAGLVVVYGPEQVNTHCVEFPESDITGVELLERADVGPGISPEGALCSIGGQGCPVDDCFCQCFDLNDCSYWGYYLRQEGEWVYSNWGVMAMADTTIVAHGDMQAWVWGRGDPNDPPGPPPDVTFEAVCPVAPVSPPLEVPEPATLSFVIGGLGLLAGYIGMRGRRR